MVKVYDLPTRAFHWLFVVLFITAFSIGKFIDDDSWGYAYHMLIGLLMTYMVILRVLWGVVGTKYAKFSSFSLRPKDLIKYLSSIMTGKTKRYLGHNPASSFAAIFMFLACFILTCSGVLMIKGIGKEFFEEIHELIVSGFLLVALFHIAGLIYHQTQHRDGTISSMISGRKSHIDGQDGIKSQAVVPLIVFVVSTLGFGSYLVNNYDGEKQQLTMSNQILRLGEQDNENSLEYYNKYYNVEENENQIED